MELRQPIFDLCFSALRRFMVALAISRPLVLLAPSLDEGSEVEGSEAERSLATAPITPLESALTSHFAPKFDLKSFRMRTYVTPGGGGWVPKVCVNSLILNKVTSSRLVLVPRSSHHYENRSFAFRVARRAAVSERLT